MESICRESLANLAELTEPNTMGPGHLFNLLSVALIYGNFLVSFLTNIHGFLNSQVPE